MRNGALVEKSEADYNDAPYIIRDEMEPLRHMATGKIITSKRAFRAETKASGCIEVGDQANYGHRRVATPLDRETRVRRIKDAIDQLSARGNR
jgi:hypothetical protein